MGTSLRPSWAILTPRFSNRHAGDRDFGRALGEQALGVLGKVKVALGR